MRVWRICSAAHAAASFDGQRTLQAAGRWNPAGVRMVYTSSSLALAAVELFVHLDSAVPPRDLVSITAVLPDGVFMEHVDAKSLPEDWKFTEREELKQLGAEWAASRRSVALLVPSEAISGEWNVLLNPEHPLFPKVRVDAPRRFEFDPRMFKGKC